MASLKVDAARGCQPWPDATGAVWCIAPPERSDAKGGERARVDLVPMLRRGLRPAAGIVVLADPQSSSVSYSESLSGTPARASALDSAGRLSNTDCPAASPAPPLPSPPPQAAEAVLLAGSLSKTAGVGCEPSPPLAGTQPYPDTAVLSVGLLSKEEGACGPASPTCPATPWPAWACEAWGADSKIEGVLPTGAVSVAPATTSAREAPGTLSKTDGACPSLSPHVLPYPDTALLAMGLLSKVEGSSDLSLAEAEP
mmetsp:Transcript_142400/g.442799  ORF Transcript_142400/g.442799 Transcript_142400/m.442799 type:complete len:255 (+) Transcript_142400:210-974(+)